MDLSILPKNSRYLVVGINGTIGSALFSCLQSNSENSNISVWGTTQRQAYADQESIFYLNLLDHPSSWQFPDVKFDVVYLCAGICRMALCEENPAYTYKINVEAMGALAKTLSERGTFVIYLSTNQVFSGNEPMALAHSSYQPLNEYGRQKSIIENYIKNNCEQSAIVRLTKVVEPNMELIKTWINRLNEDQSIEAFHDMTLAPVSLRQVINVLTKVGQLKQAGTYQVSGREDISYFDLANYLANYLQKPSSLVKSVSAFEKGIKKSFLPLFTTLDCSSTIALCGEIPPHFSEVILESF